MNGRIKHLRKEKRIDQKILGIELGVSQQVISRIENDMNTLSIDLLINIAKYFNVSTDYILGLTDIRRTFEAQNAMDKTVDEYYYLIKEYNKLSEVNQESLRIMIVRMLLTQI